MDNKQLKMVTFKQAKFLKDLGFDWECRIMYDCDGILQYESVFSNWNKGSNFFSAPTVALTLKWFRDVKKTVCTVDFNYYQNSVYKTEYYASIGLNNNDHHWYSENYDTYEDAESALLDELLTRI